MSNRIEKVIVFIVVVFAIFVLSAYIIAFHREPISGDPALWGQLGDYLGGTLNPFFGLLTTIFAFFAYRNTVEQLNLQKTSTFKDNLVKNLQIFTTLFNFKHSQDSKSQYSSVDYFEALEEELFNLLKEHDEKVHELSKFPADSPAILKIQEGKKNVEKCFFEYLEKIIPYVKIINDCCAMIDNTDGENQFEKLIFLYAGDTFKRIIHAAIYSNIVMGLDETSEYANTVLLFKAFQSRLKP